MLTETPLPKQTSRFCLTSRKGNGINMPEGTNFLESVPSAHQQRMSQVTKSFMALKAWEKVMILPLLGSKTISCTAAPASLKLLTGRRSKRK